MSALANRCALPGGDFVAPVRGRNRSGPGIRGGAPSDSLIINTVAFCAWIAQADSGDFLEYHRGLLALDASLYGQTFKGETRSELARVARRAWWAAEQGLVHLVQRRNGPDNFSYIAIARPRTPQVSASLSSVLLKEVA